jgi:GH35 family endo-1,4-beta-xylanase
MQLKGLLKTIRTNTMTSAQKLFAAAAAFLALATFSSASAAEDDSQPAPEHYGCDNPKSVEQYVLNLINDAKKNGISCDSMQLQASITSYCSGCGEHPELMSSCVKTGMEKLAAACSTK